MNVHAEAVESARARAQAYRLLASVLFRELDADQLAFLAANELPCGEDERMRDGAQRIHRFLRLAPPDVLTRLRVDYARVFLAAGVYEGDTAVPFESVFTSEEGLMMQGARDDVLRRYAQESVTIDASLRTPEDHLAFEFEFLAITSDRIADAWERGDGAEAERLASVQRDFLRDHVLNWIDQLAERVERFAEEPFYPAFMAYAAGFSAEDAAFLEEAEG